MSTIGESIKKHRTEKGLTQEQLAVLAGITKNTLSLYERDRCDPSLFIATCIADVLDISLDLLAARPKYVEEHVDILKESNYIRDKATKEILVEIEALNNRVYNRYVFEDNDYSEDDVAIECAINYGTDISNGIDEIKKKYAESEKESGAE